MNDFKFNFLQCLFLFQLLLQIKLDVEKKLIIATAAIVVLGFFCSYFLNSGSTVMLTAFICIGMALMGFTYGPLGTFLSELFPTTVRFQELH